MGLTGGLATVPMAVSGAVLVVVEVVGLVDGPTVPADLAGRASWLPSRAT